MAPGDSPAGRRHPADEVGRSSRGLQPDGGGARRADQSGGGSSRTSRTSCAPPSALRALLENLVDGVVRPDDAVLRTALAPAERLGTLVGDLLDLAAASTGGPHRARARARPGRARTRRWGTPLAEAGGLTRQGTPATFAIDVARPTCTVTARCPTPLAQVLANLPRQRRPAQPSSRWCASPVSAPGWTARTTGGSSSPTKGSGIPHGRGRARLRPLRLRRRPRVVARGSARGLPAGCASSTVASIAAVPPEQRGSAGRAYGSCCPVAGHRTAVRRGAGSRSARVRVRLGTCRRRSRGHRYLQLPLRPTEPNAATAQSAANAATPATGTDPHRGATPCSPDARRVGTRPERHTTTGTRRPAHRHTAACRSVRRSRSSTPSSATCGPRDRAPGPSCRLLIACPGGRRALRRGRADPTATWGSPSSLVLLAGGEASSGARRVAPGWTPWMIPWATG